MSCKFPCLDYSPVHNPRSDLPKRPFHRTLGGLYSPTSPSGDDTRVESKFLVRHRRWVEVVPLSCRVTGDRNTVRGCQVLVISLFGVISN